MKQTKKEITLWARQCSVTGQGIMAGYVWSDGCFYCVDDDAIAHPEFRKDRENIINYIPEDIYDIDGYENYDEDEDEEYLSAIKRVKQNKDTDKDLMTLSYLFGLHYYTEWLDDEDVQYAEIDGVMYEEGTDEFNEACNKRFIIPFNEIYSILTKN